MNTLSKIGWTAKFDMLLHQKHITFVKFNLFYIVISSFLVNYKKLSDPVEWYSIVLKVFPKTLWEYFLELKEYFLEWRKYLEVLGKYFLQLKEYFLQLYKLFFQHQLYLKILQEYFLTQKIFLFFAKVFLFFAGEFFLRFQKHFIELKVFFLHFQKHFFNLKTFPEAIFRISLSLRKSFRKFNHILINGSEKYILVSLDDIFRNDFNPKYIYKYFALSNLDLN